MSDVKGETTSERRSRLWVEYLRASGASDGAFELLRESWAWDMPADAKKTAQHRMRVAWEASAANAARALREYCETAID